MNNIEFRITMKQLLEYEFGANLVYGPTIYELCYSERGTKYKMKQVPNAKWRCV